MLVFVENIGHKYDFKGGGLVSGRVWGWGWGGPDPKKKSFNRLLIHIFIVDGYISMFEVDTLSSFFTNCQKITWGYHGGHLMPPMVFFSKDKNYLSNQMHPTTPPTPHHITHPPTPHNTTTPPTHRPTPTLTTNPTHQNTPTHPPHHPYHHHHQPN